MPYVIQKHDADQMQGEGQAVKAVGDWELDVLGLPFGGPHAGKDAQGEYFSPATNFHADKFTLPPVVYYHGFTPDGKPAGEPAYIGKTVSREQRSDGVWFRVVLDRASELAQRVWEAAKNGIARASSGSISHLRRVAADGHILQWPVAELSLFDTGDNRQPANAYAVVVPVIKMIYMAAGLDPTLLDSVEPEAAAEAGGESAPDAAAQADQQFDTEDDMSEIRDEIRGVLAELEADTKAKTEAERARKAELDAAVKQAKADVEAEYAAKNRLPGGMPYVEKFPYTRRYDNMGADDLAFMVGLLDAPTRDGIKATHTSTGAPRFQNREETLKALALKMDDEAQKGNEAADSGMKALPIKSNEIQQSTLATYGDEWVGVAYSTRLWNAIRQGTFVTQKLAPYSIEVPQGMESIKIPLEGGDPKFYKVAQVASIDSTMKTPVATVTSSQLVTAQQSLTLGKMGARVLWSGELEEDSLMPWVSNLRRQLEVAGAEQMEHAIIDGDTEAGATTNINDIAGTPAATDLFMLVNGFRKLALITNAANSRSGTTLDETDFLSTLKLMGAAGKNATDFNAVDFIIDPWTHFKALTLSAVKTRDVFISPTIENGQLTAIYGHRIYTSYFMNYAGVLLGTVSTDTYKYLSNSAGKVDQDTEANNTLGSILAVRWDQWLMGWKRRMTIETTRIPNADATEIVALARWGLVYRDVEASAISYNITIT